MEESGRDTREEDWAGTLTAGSDLLNTIFLWVAGRSMD